MRLQVYKANLVGHPDNKVKGFINLMEDYLKFPLPKKLKQNMDVSQGKVYQT